MSAAWGMAMKGASLSVKGGEAIWKSLIRPVLEYAAAVLG